MQRSVALSGDYDAAQRNSVGNVVHLANAVSKLAGVYAGEVNTDQNQTLVMVGRALLGIDGDALERLSNLRDRVQQQIA